MVRILNLTNAPLDLLPCSSGNTCLGCCRQQRGFRRRSEVDRRLDSLVASNGKLRDPGPSSIIRMLRLFNLCDLGTSTSNPNDVLADKVHFALPTVVFYPHTSRQVLASEKPC